MIKGFYNNAANLEYKNIIAIDALRDLTKDRLNEARGKLDPSSAFNKAKSAHSHDSLFACLFLNAMMWGMVGDIMTHATGGDMGIDFSHDGLPATCLEVYELAADDIRQKRLRAVDGYPEGRVSDPLSRSVVHDKFNMVAANENSRADYDEVVEIAMLAQMLDTLDMMKKRGITAMGVDKKETVYKTLGKARRNMLENQAFSSFQMPVRRAMM